MVYQLTYSNRRLYAACQAGLFSSQDDGQTWQNCFAAWGNKPLPAVAVAHPPHDSENRLIFVGTAGGLLRSSNGGADWENVPLPPPPPTIVALAFSPNYDLDGTIFAASLEDGVLFSSDRGGHWVAWNFGLLDLNTLCLAISPHYAGDETVFVGTQSGLFRSTNGGRAWREVELPVGYEAVLSLAFSPAYPNDHTLFAGTESQGVLVSRDGGDSWQQLVQFPDPINAIAFDPNDPQQALLLHGGQVLHTADGGQNWSSWRHQALADLGISAILAPQGFAPGVTVWLGLTDGSVISQA